MASPPASLTLKDVQSHLIKTIIGAVLGAFVVAVVFYFKTNHDISNLQQVSAENAQSIKMINSSLTELNLQVQQTNTPATINQIEIQNLSQRLDGVETNLKRLEDKVDKLIDLQLQQNNRK